MIKYRKVDESRPFNYFAIQNHATGTCYPVVLDIDFEDKTVEIAVDESPKTILEKVHRGLLMRFDTYCIPTPTGANEILNDERLREIIQSLMDRFTTKEDSQGNTIGFISYTPGLGEFSPEHVEGRLLDLGVPCIGNDEVIEQVYAIEASTFFDSEADKCLFEQYRMGNPEKDFTKIVEQIQDEFNGQRSEDNSKLLYYLLDIEEHLHQVYEWYVDCISELIENAGLEFGEFSEDYNFLETECHISSELAPWVRYGGWNKEGDVVVGGNTFDDIAEQIKQLKED